MVLYTRIHTKYHEILRRFENRIFINLPRHQNEKKRRYKFVDKNINNRRGKYLKIVENFVEIGDKSEREEEKSGRKKEKSSPSAR